MFGIIGAMDKEVDLLKAHMEDVVVETYSNMEFYKGKLGGQDVVVNRCGVGKVFAAMGAQIMALKYNVDAIINTGAAGSLNNDMNIGDILLSTGAVHHDVDATCFGYSIGQIPSTDTAIFEADKELVALAKSILQKEMKDVNVFEGLVASGDQFVSSDEKKQWILKNFDAYCVEMEGAAIAQVAKYNNIPFIIIRSISDKADGSEMQDYEEFENKAATKSAIMVESIMNNIKK